MLRLKVNTPRRIALTPGEPAGIGPDLAVMLAQQARHDELVVIADTDLLLTRAKQLDLPLSIREFHQDSRITGDKSGTLCVNPCTLARPVVAGTLDVHNTPYVLSTLDNAVNGCVDGRYQAMVTGPVHKGIINDAGRQFSGHTEYIANLTDGYPVMMLLADQLRVALATTHIPVSQIAQSVSRDLLVQVITVLHRDMRSKFGIDKPHLLVCGLNPHAGEGGHLGREEIDIIIPTLDLLRARGMNITGPLPADTLFTPRHLNDADAVLAMYHDQGLPVLKYAGFGNAVNLTLGLPIIRTSVDHGTALDLAGSGQVDAGSIHAAIKLALDLCRTAQ